MKHLSMIFASLGLITLASCGGAPANNIANDANASGPAVGTSLNDNSGIPPVDTSGADIPAFDNETAPTVDNEAANTAANVSVANSIGDNSAR